MRTRDLNEIKTVLGYYINIKKAAEFEGKYQHLAMVEHLIAAVDKELHSNYLRAIRTRMSRIRSHRANV